MSYVDGFIVAVPTAKKEAYREHAAKVAPVFKAHGAGRMVEAWGDQVPEGKVTDFRRAVKATPDEAVLFSWIEYPSKAARQGANDKMMNEPAMEGAETPFDATRMVYGGFEVLLDAGRQGQAGYVDGQVAPTSAGKDAYLQWAREVSKMLLEYGAARVVEGWSDDVPVGKVTDFYGAVQAGEGEAITFSWIEWPSKAVRDEAWGKIQAEGRLGGEMAFDGRRAIHGGFTPIVDA
jgi:uncharacterized protein YbaA (DUF1428 family)